MPPIVDSEGLESRCGVFVRRLRGEQGFHRNANAFGAARGLLFAVARNGFYLGSSERVMPPLIHKYLLS